MVRSAFSFLARLLSGCGSRPAHSLVEHEKVNELAK